MHEKSNDKLHTLAMCWRLKLRNGREIGFTNHDVDITIGGLKYFAKSGFTPSAISSTNGLSVDNLDIKGIIDHEIIRTEDILAGLYDYAEIQVFLVNYMKLDDEVIKLRRGWLGEVKLSKDSFVVEVRGMLQALASANITEFYSNKCKADFCDERCKLKKDDYIMRDIVVIEVISKSSIRFKSSRINTKGDNSHLSKIEEQISESLVNVRIFNYGLLTFINGYNQGLSMEIKYCSGDTIDLALSMPYQINEGDKFNMISGCDKSLKSCSEIYRNAINFRGEPHIPIAQKLKNNIN